MRPTRRLLAAACLACTALPADAADAFEEQPIAYSRTEPANVVADLAGRLAAGEATLSFEGSTGYLRSVLEALAVPVSSQTLVFSKTSLQQQRISPRNPRALYFNDEVYVGFVRGGDVLEVSVADPRLGTVFYTLDQAADRPPRFERQTDNCLLCHGGAQTQGVPGHVIRSLYPDSSGQPIFSAGSYRVDDTTPLADRWGGWYVSGRHGEAPHLGNVTYRRRPEPGEARDTSGFNQTDLGGRFDASGYLSPHSDLVALSVLAHQASAHTVLAKASFDSRTALHREAALNRELGEPAGHRWPSTNTVLDAAADALVECFLFCGAASLPGPIEGTTAFAAEFASAGPADPTGRSLRALDLETRLLEHPCSFLIYSPSFDALPEELRRRFWDRMDAVLARGEGGERFAHLSAGDRTAIREILAATKPGVPEHWAMR
ncbi:MAG: hypothetical protein ACKOCX_08420 [Planctomycetota bacterium]